MNDLVDSYPYDLDREHMEPEYEPTSRYLIYVLVITALVFWLTITHMEIFWWQKTANEIKPQVVIDKTLCEFSVFGDYVTLSDFIIDNCVLHIERGAEQITVIGGYISNRKGPGIVIKGETEMRLGGTTIFDSNPGIEFRELSEKEFEKRYPKVEGN